MPCSLVGLPARLLCFHCVHLPALLVLSVGKLYIVQSCWSRSARQLAAAALSVSSAFFGGRSEAPGLIGHHLVVSLLLRQVMGWAM